MSVLQKLTEGIISRDLSKEGSAILEKWERTGLLEGLDDDVKRNNMAVLLENQAKELLRETTTMAGGDVEGFAAVAFPIVRRVFAGLIANELVSVQPMSLPSGLIFFLDFTKSMGNQSAYDDNDTRDGVLVGDTSPSSIYGGGKVGSGIIDGVNLGDADPSGFTGLRQGLTAARAAAQVTGSAITHVRQITLSGSMSAVEAKALRYDPDLMAGDGSTVTGYVNQLRVVETLLTREADTLHPLYLNNTSDQWARVRRKGMSSFNLTSLDSTVIDGDGAFTSTGNVVRRLTNLMTPAGGAASVELFWQSTAAQPDLITLTDAGASEFSVEFAIDDNISEKSSGVGALVGANEWEMENSKAIPEINIKVDSTAVT